MIPSSTPSTPTIAANSGAKRAKTSRSSFAFSLLLAIHAGPVVAFAVVELSFVGTFGPGAGLVSQAEHANTAAMTAGAMNLKAILLVVAPLRMSPSANFTRVVALFEALSPLVVPPPPGIALYSRQGADVQGHLCNFSVVALYS